MKEVRVVKEMCGKGGGDTKVTEGNVKGRRGRLSERGEGERMLRFTSMHVKQLCFIWTQEVRQRIPVLLFFGGVVPGAGAQPHKNTGDGKKKTAMSKHRCSRNTILHREYRKKNCINTHAVVVLFKKV